MLNIINKNRTTSCNNINNTSSRSHSIINIKFLVASLTPILHAAPKPLFSEFFISLNFLIFLSLSKSRLGELFTTINSTFSGIDGKSDAKAASLWKLTIIMETSELFVTIKSRARKVLVLL